MTDADTKPDAAHDPADQPPKINGATNDIVIKLRKAVIAHGEEVKELKFREPTALDIEACGTPVMIDYLDPEKPKMSFEIKSMFAMMSRLAAVPPSTIKQMNTKDWEFVAMSLAYSFFIPTSADQP